jgi:hypothetical protein
MTNADPQKDIGRTQGNPELTADGTPPLPDATDYEVRIGVEQRLPVAGKIDKRVAVASEELERESRLVARTTGPRVMQKAGGGDHRAVSRTREAA